MHRLADYPIKKKLTWMNILASGTALMLACGAFVGYGVIIFREAIVRNLTANARIIGSNSVSAITFNDPQTAQSTLAALKATSNVVAAGIYTLDGQPFATYSRDTVELQSRQKIPQVDAQSQWFENGHAKVAEKIIWNGKPVGIVYIESDLVEVDALVRRYAVTGILVLFASLLPALLISSRFQRVISRPIVRLAETAQIFSREKNYSLRAAESNTNDEIGVLIRAFNEMLDQIQERDAALQSAQERLNLSLKSAGIGIWHWNLVTNEITWDDYLHPLFGLMPGTFPGTYDYFETLIHPDDRERVRREITDAADKDSPCGSQFRAVWPSDGSVHALSFRGKVYRNETGEPVAMTGVCWDITELKRTEQEVRRLNEELEHRVAQRTLELEATNKELEAFTYSVAHDLRAPLRHIHGFCKILVDEFVAEMQPTGVEYLHDILDSTENMGRLIDDLLALGRISRQELNLQLTGLSSVADAALKDLKSDLRDRDIEWQVEQLPFVECDPGLMKQVFANLLSNAIKYTRPRKPAVIIVGTMNLGGELVVFVRDNGVGFNMKYANKLFGVFQRMHRKEDFEGTGVGLATVQRILNKHGGRIWAEADVEKGATFYFTTGSTEKADDSKPALIMKGNA